MFPPSIENIVEFQKLTFFALFHLVLNFFSFLSYLFCFHCRIFFWLSSSPFSCLSRSLRVDAKLFGPRCDALILERCPSLCTIRDMADAAFWSECILPRSHFSFGEVFSSVQCSLFAQSSTSLPFFSLVRPATWTGEGDRSQNGSSARSFHFIRKDAARE